MTTISMMLKEIRKRHRLTQPMFAKKTGVGLKFIRDLEQGKETVCLKKLNHVLSHYNYEMHPVGKRSKLPYTAPMRRLRLNEIDDPERLPGET